MILIRKKNIQNNLFVSIGAGINQIPLIKEARALGLQIIGVDKNISAAGMHLCDIKIQESIENYAEIFRKLKELLIDGEIVGILSKSFGPAIKTVGFLAKQLGIPLLPFDRVDEFVNKDRMKKVLKKNNINTSNYIVYSKKNEKNKINIPSPFVIKPVIGHAKNEVILINDFKYFKKYLNSMSSKNNEYLLETYIKGDEVIAIGIVYKGKFYLVELTDKIKSPLPYFIDIMHISPSKYYHLWDKIQKIGQEIVESFEIYTSPLIMELIVSENEEIFVIETAPEFGGEFLSDTLIPERTGYNIIKEAIKAVINKNFIPPRQRKIRNAVVVKYITGSKGFLLSFNPLKNKSQGILFSRIFSDIGSHIQKPTTNLDRIGVIITKGKTIGEAMDRVQQAEQNMNIRIGDMDTKKKK